MDNLHGDTIVSQITISCARNGVMKVEGSITDEVYALAMLETAKDVVKIMLNVQLVMIKLSLCLLMIPL